MNAVKTINSGTFVSGSTFAVAMMAAIALVCWTPPSQAKRKRAIPSVEELTKIVGDKGDFSPKMLAKVRPGMDRAAVKALFPKLGRTSVYGYAKARVKGFKGVQEVRFHFGKANPDGTGKRTKLRRATVVFKGWLRNRTEFFERMMTLARAKWGEPARPGNNGQVERKIITWVDASKTRVVQFARIGNQYELSIDLE